MTKTKKRECNRLLWKLIFNLRYEVTSPSVRDVSGFKTREMSQIGFLGKRMETEFSCGLSPRGREGVEGGGDRGRSWDAEKPSDGLGHLPQALELEPRSEMSWVGPTGPGLYTPWWWFTVHRQPREGLGLCSWAVSEGGQHAQLPCHQGHGRGSGGALKCPPWEVCVMVTAKHFRL